MTVKKLKEELQYYEDDQQVIFEISSEIEAESWTEDRYGGKSVYIDKKLNPSFIGNIRGDMRIELEVTDG